MPGSSGCNRARHLNALRRADDTHNRDGEQSDMVRMQGLSDAFTSDNPDIRLWWAVLAENALRQRVTTDIANRRRAVRYRHDRKLRGADLGQTRLDLSALGAMPKDYDVDDILPTIREGLSFDGRLYAAPFYGESSFTMYRTDLFEQGRPEMPEAPTWDFIRTAASAIRKEAGRRLWRLPPRGSRMGENIALITAMANSAARWFEDWRPHPR